MIQLKENLRNLRNLWIKIMTKNEGMANEADSMREEFCILNAPSTILHLWSSPISNEFLPGFKRRVTWQAIL